MANGKQIIALGSDQYYAVRRNNVPRPHVKHFVDGYHHREFTGRRKYITATDPVTGDSRQLEVETDALAYYQRGESLRRHVDAGHKTLMSGEWLRANGLERRVVNECHAAQDALARSR